MSDYHGRMMKLPATEWGASYKHGHRDARHAAAEIATAADIEIARLTAENEALREEVKRRDAALAESAERNRRQIAENEALREVLAKAREFVGDFSGPRSDRILAIITAALSARQGEPK